MRFAEKQGNKIESLLANARENVCVGVLTFDNEILYNAENGCETRALSQRRGWGTRAFVAFSGGAKRRLVASLGRSCKRRTYRSRFLGLVS